MTQIIHDEIDGLEALVKQLIDSRPHPCCKTKAHHGCPHAFPDCYCHEDCIPDCEICIYIFENVEKLEFRIDSLKARLLIEINNEVKYG